MAVARRKLALISLPTLLLASSVAVMAQAAAKGDQSLVGLWGTEQSFGPLVRATLTIDARQPQWRASIAGFQVFVDQSDGRVTFSLPDGAGEFRGSLDHASKIINGEWVQPAGDSGHTRGRGPFRLER